MILRCEGGDNGLGGRGVGQFLGLRQSQGVGEGLKRPRSFLETRPGLDGGHLGGVQPKLEGHLGKTVGERIRLFRAGFLV